MSYVDRSLQPGERIVRRASLHWITHWHGLLALIIAAVIFMVGKNAQTGGGILQILALVVAVLGLVMLARTMLRQLGTEIAVTDRRVIYKTGLFGRETAEMNIDKIETVTVHQSLLGRILGYGAIDLRGTGEGIEDLRRIANPVQLRAAIGGR